MKPIICIKSFWQHTTILWLSLWLLFLYSWKILLWTNKTGISFIKKNSSSVQVGMQIIPDEIVASPLRWNNPLFIHKDVRGISLFCLSRLKSSPRLKTSLEWLNWLQTVYIVILGLSHTHHEKWSWPVFM